jgi:hypothetical protein
MLYRFFSDLGLTDWAIIVVVITFFIDLTPGIKFNPVTFIIKKLGEAFNHSVDKKLDELETKVDSKISNVETQLNELKDKTSKQYDLLQEQRKDLDTAEVNRLKKEILEFSNQLSQGKKFTIEEYRTIMDCHKRYEDIVDKYQDLTNGRIDPEYNAILKHYEEHKECGQYMF